MLAEILRLDSLIAKCLEETQKLKSIVVNLQQYEYSAKIREYEKQFETIRIGISSLSYPIVPSKGLTRNGSIYSSQLFSYGHSMGWKGLPDYINHLLTTRKNELNELVQFSETDTSFLVQLNKRLKNEECRIDKFINSLLTVYQLNNLDTIIDDFSYGGIIIQFLTSKEFMRSARKDGIAKWALYEIEIPIEIYLSEVKEFYKTTETDNLKEIHKHLPVELINQDICYLLFYLGNNSSLAFQDMLSIDQILISFTFLCRLQRI